MEEFRNDIALLKSLRKARKKFPSNKKISLVKKRSAPYERPYMISPEFATFLNLDQPIASIHFCTLYIGMYLGLSEKLGIQQPSRLVPLFKDHPEMTNLFPNIAFGNLLQKNGFITKEQYRGEWDLRRIEMIEELLRECRALFRRERDDLDVLVKKWY